MSSKTIDIFVFLTEACETSIALEMTAQIEEDDISLTICSLFEEDEQTFGMDITSINADSYLDVFAYRELFSQIRSVDPDLVHVHPNVSGSVVRVMSTVIGIPVISTQHHPHNHFSTAKNMINGTTNWLNEIVICPSLVTAESFNVLESVLMDATGTEKIIIPNGVNLEILDQANDVDTPKMPEGTLVGTASRLVPHKQIDELIRVAANLAEEYPGLHFIIVGDGPEKESLERFAVELGVTDRIHFFGYLPTRTEVHAVMNELDIFAFPTCSEGFGVAIAEAMALETAVVVNDIPALREVVGDAGCFVDATDTDEFANAIANLVTDADHRVALAERASDRIKSHYNLERSVTEYVNLYRRVAARSQQ